MVRVPSGFTVSSSSLVLVFFTFVYLYKSNDVADFADKTRQVLNDLEDYQLVAETIREECRERFCIDRYISGLREIYLKVKKY
jgi:hypothetical protein